MKGIVNAGGADCIMVVGGGVRTPTVMDKRARKTAIPAETGVSQGWDVDFVEARALAFARFGRPVDYP